VVQLALGGARVPNGLIIGAIVGPAVAAILLGGAASRHRLVHGLRQGFDRAQLWRTARAYHRFPRYSLPADLLNAIAQQFTPVLLAIAFSPVAAGLYAFAVRIVRVPLIVVSTALNSVLRKEGVEELRRSGTLTPLTLAIVRYLAILGAGPFVVMFFWGDGIFAALFGQRWRAAGEILQVLSPGIWLEFVAFPLAAILLITHKQRYSLIVQAFSVLSTLSAIFLGRRYLPDFRAVCILLSAIMVVTNGAAIVLSLKAAGTARWIGESAEAGGLAAGPLAGSVGNEADVRP
jgi:O-antigen/teichoic acid export membrane protein